MKYYVTLAQEVGALIVIVLALPIWLWVIASLLAYEYACRLWRALK
jgi:hypothetical protein